MDCYQEDDRQVGLSIFLINGKNWGNKCAHIDQFKSHDVIYSSYLLVYLNRCSRCSVTVNWLH